MPRFGFAGRSPSDPHLVDVDAQVHHAACLLRPTIGRGVRLELECDSAPWRVRVDPGELENVVVNLVVNARDALPEGGTVAVYTSRERVPSGVSHPSTELAPGDYVRLRVVDNGEGMTETVRAHALEPFFTTKGPGRGTGLGLASADTFASRAEGGVQITSRPGTGCPVDVYTCDALRYPRTRPLVPAWARARSTRSRIDRCQPARTRPGVMLSRSAMGKSKRAPSAQPMRHEESIHVQQPRFRTVRSGAARDGCPPPLKSELMTGPDPNSTPGAGASSLAGFPLRLRILVVDDDPRVRRLTVRRLNFLGHDTIQAENGPSALIAYDAGQGVDLLFTDMVMPGGLSGLEIAQALRAKNPTLPVVIASGYSEELLGIDRLRESAIEVLVKPYGNEDLAKALRSSFERYRMDPSVLSR